VCCVRIIGSCKLLIGTVKQAYINQHRLSYATQINRPTVCRILLLYARRTILKVAIFK
jgi:hypothetical protein